jgi:hypothetical protein
MMPDYDDCGMKEVVDFVTCGARCRSGSRLSQGGRLRLDLT